MSFSVTAAWRFLLLQVLPALFTLHECNGQISITDLPYNPLVTNFNTYNPNNAANLVATIPQGWTASSSGTPIYNGQGTGSSSTGGYWSYGLANEFSIGGLRSSSTGNITYTVTFVNNSGTTINALTLAWDYEQWRYANSSGWNCSGTGSLVGNTTLNTKDFSGIASGTNGVVTVTSVPLFTLSGLSITDGSSFGITWITTDLVDADNGASIDNFYIAACTNPGISLGTDPNVCEGDSVALLSFNNAQGSPDQFSIDYSDSANAAGFIDITNAALPTSPISFVIPPSASIDDYSGTLTVRNSAGGCVSNNYDFTIHLISCTAPYMIWIPLHEGSIEGSCVSETECDPSSENIVCYALEYTPNVTGLLTSYTTGFFIDCSADGNPVVFNHSCVMVDNSFEEDGCDQFDLVKINCSANEGTIMVSQNTPLMLHQVCLDIPSSESLDIIEDELTNLTTSITLSGGGFVTEEPGYSSVSASWDQECVTLPLRWLQFKASRYDQFMTQLDWTTSEEINISHFEIQRSNDNGHHFCTIGKLNADDKVLDIHSYQFIDRNALSGENYYRLKQIDFDGLSDFSPIRTVRFASENFIVNVWPNPASSDVTIYIYHADEAGEIIIVDITGKEIFRNNFEEGASTKEFEVNDLSPGLYTLIVTSAIKKHIEKIVVIE